MVIGQSIHWHTHHGSVVKSENQQIANSDSKHILLSINIQSINKNQSTKLGYKK